ncbi:MAG: hypothetical protein LAN62_17255, partial [Acidobacteriia bacterium]|nr:hypothetical protein [Terriglobia bacterium]
MSRTHNAIVRICALAGVLACQAGLAVGQGSGDALMLGFKDPPDLAKPRVWWHWMNGNVTKEGITADLEWMKRVGLGGMQMFDGDMGTPRFVDKRLMWMTPEWKDAFRHAAVEANRLGIEMSMATSGGWSESGGPSVKPEEAMKKIVWSETAVQGPRKFTGVLAQPPSVNGLYQNIARAKDFEIARDATLPGAKPMAKAPPPPPDPTYYADTKVIAYRVPEGEARMADLHPKVTSSAADIDGAALIDGDVGRTIAVPFPEGVKQQWVQFEFAQPYKAQSFTIAVSGGGAIPEGKVQA